MRLALLVGILCSSIVTARESSAQIHLRDTPVPVNVSAGAAWRSTGQPLFYAGSYFYRAGATVFFDGHTMRPAGSDHGVVFYSDVTQEPYSIVYLPIGRGQMQPYERMRQGELAGTVGSRTPSFPVDFEIEQRTDAELARIARENDGRRAERIMGARRDGRRGSAETSSAPQRASTGASEFTAVGAVMIVPPNREGVLSGRVLDNRDLPNAPGTTSLWVEFEQARWYNAGPAVVLDETRFDRAGELNGFSVYRERAGASDRIYVSATLGGLVAPYQRR